MFAAGAGSVGNYDNCSWEIAGIGQFRPGAGSSPAVGTEGHLETITEYRVEMVCPDNKLPEVIRVLLVNHPYETPAWHVYEIKTTLKQIK